MDGPLRLLHLEDNAVDAELIQAIFADDQLPVEWQRVWTRADYLAALQQQSFDLILADHALPGFDGLSALALAQALAPDTPFIFVTGALGEEMAIDTLRSGATDYVLKSRLGRLVPAVRRALREASERRERQRAEAAAHAEHQWLRVTLSSIGDAVIATDTQGRVTFMNTVAETVTGWSQAAAIGQPIDVVFDVVNEHTREKVENPVQRVIQEGVGAGLVDQTVLIAKDGTIIPVDDSGAPIRDAAGQLLGVVLIFRDITASKQASAILETRVRQQAVVAELGRQALAVLGLPALMQKVVQVVADTLEVEFSKVLELLPDGQALRVIAGVGWDEGVVGHTLVEASLASQAGYTLAADSPVMVQDLPTETRFVGMPILHHHDVVSGMTVVVPGAARPFGVLGAHTARARTFTPDDANFLQSVANVLGEAIARHRAEEALRVSRDQIAAILASIAQGVTVQAPSGQVIYANDVAARLIGFPSAEALLAAPLQQVMQKFRLLDDASNPFPLEQLPGRRALQGELNPHALIRFQVIDTGQDHWADVRARPIFNAQGQVERAVNVFTDITSLKRAEMAQRLLAEASRLLTTSLNYETRLLNVAQLAAGVLADWCIVDVLDKEESLRLVAVAHVDPAQAALVWELRRNYPPDRDKLHPIWRVISTGQRDFAPQISEEELRARAQDQRHLELLQALNIRSHLVLPLRARGRTLGAISFVMGESGRRYDEDTLALADELAQRVALALDNALLYAEAQRLNAELEARVEERTEELEVALEELRARNEELDNEVQERRQAEDRLHESREQLRQLSAHQQAAREDERKHIARDIHDQLGGNLTGIKMDVMQLQKNAQTLSPEQLVEKTRALAKAIDATVMTVRRIATDLRPGILDDFGLVAAIEWQLSEFQTRWGIETQLTSQVDDLPVDPDGSTAVFRVFQETLTNVARHAEATRVEVSLEKQDNYLVLQVHDNGRGINLNDINARKSLGLLGMRERIHLLSGELDIQGVPGQGTAVLVKIPLGKKPFGPSAGGPLLL